MASIYNPIPNNPFYYPETNSISTPQGHVIAGSGVSIDQFGVMNVASALGGTVTSVTAGTGLAGGTITVSGTIDLVPATNATLGGVKIGANLLISPDGTLSALPPSTGTISGVTPGAGLVGGGSSGNVTLSLIPASTTQFGGVQIGPGLSSTGGLLTLNTATTAAYGGVRLSTNAETIAGVDATIAVTPASLAAKTASLTARGIVQLSDSVATNDSTKAATQTAAKIAYDAALVAQATANAALPLAGGTMTGIINFAPGQTFPGVALPIATTLSLGVVRIGSGLNITPAGILSTAYTGTVTSVTAGTGLGAPATGNAITTSGVIKLLPPSIDKLTIGGVKEGPNIEIGIDGTITTKDLLKTNNPFAYNSYIWPIPDSFGMAPGANGQVLTLLDHVTGTVGWTSTGSITSVVAGTGTTVTVTNGVATINLAPVPSVVPGNFGATALIPTLAINQYGQITSVGQANPYAPFQIATVSAPPVLVLDFADNNLFWEWILQGNVTIQDPLNAESGQTGSLLISQNPITPYTITWGAGWQFADFTPYLGNPVAAAVDLIEFTVVRANYIVVTNIVKNIG